MLIFLLAWAFVGWLSLTFGLLGEEILFRFLPAGSPPGERRMRALGIDRLILFGFLILTGLVSLCSVFLPIHLGVKGLFALVGAGLTFRYAGSFGALWFKARQEWRGISAPARVAILVVTLITILRCAASFVTQVDALLYHIQAIKWIWEYPVIPGLANLHGRFGFNSHYFLSSALFSWELSENRLVFPVFSLFYVLTLVRLLMGMDQALRGKRVFPFSLNLVLFILFFGSTFKFVNAVSTDYISALLVLHAFLILLEGQAARRRDLSFVWISAALIAAVTIKLSTVFLLVILPFLAFPLHWRKVVFVVVTSLFFVAPFLVRNLLLSGYLVYPVAQTAVIDLDWKVPKDLVVLEHDFIEAYSKLPMMEMYGNPKDEAEITAFFQQEAKGGTWLNIWWREKLGLRDKALLLLNLASILCLILTVVRGQRLYSLVFFGSLVALGFWLAMAPDPRFALGAILINASLVLAYAARYYLSSKYLPPALWVFSGLSAFALAMLLYLQRIHLDDYLANPRATLFALVVPIPDKDPRVQPVEGLNFRYFQPIGNSLDCGNFDGPCTPFPKPGLMMRGEDYGDGFRIAPPPTGTSQSDQAVDPQREM